MPDEKQDLFHYTTYFSRTAPPLSVQSAILVGLGIIAGIITELLIHPQDFFPNLITFITYGASSGLLVITLPAFFTIAIVKTVKRQIHLKHLMYATIVSTTIYALFLLLSSAFFTLFNSPTISYIILLAGNASIYFFWMIIGKFLLAQKRGGNIVSAAQPVLNILFYLPLGKYILEFYLPLTTALIKLFGGMFIFLITGYVIFYLLDRPLKRSANISGIKVFTIMVNQWLYSLNEEQSNEEFSFGVKRDISTDIMAFKNKKGKFKAIFVKPDIHYGPFGGFGGAIATEHLGNFLHSKYNATTLVLHGPVNIANNPVSSSQVFALGRHISNQIDSLSEKQFKPAIGNIYKASSGPCRAINIKINDSSLLTLSKAPLVTEDIEYEIGQHYKQLALKESEHAIVIDAHNSRSESASPIELKGVYFGSKYASMYDKAIISTLGKNRFKKLRLGSSQKKLSGFLGNPKDLGNGYCSVCIFEFGKERFGMLYLDSNNILPGLREQIIKHVWEKYKLELEVYTTDTHAVNSIALPSSNVLGRFTVTAKLLLAIDALIDPALSNMEEVSLASTSFVSKSFRVWGENAEEQITKASKDAIRTIKYIAPFLIVAAFIIAAWIIYSA